MKVTLVGMVTLFKLVHFSNAHTIPGVGGVAGVVPDEAAVAPDKAATAPDKVDTS